MSAVETQIYAENQSVGAQSSAAGKAVAAQPAGKAAHSPAAKSAAASAHSVKNSQNVAVKQAAPAQKNAGQTAHTAGTAHGKIAFPPFDKSFYASDILWLTICFGAFYLFMARVVLPRIGGIIETRRDRIAADLDQAARLKAEADAAVEAYQKSLKEARERAKAIARTAAENAKAKADAERMGIEAELEKKLADSAGRIAAFRDKALAGAEGVAQDIAADIVRRISGQAADQAALAQAVKTARQAGSDVL